MQSGEKPAVFDSKPNNDAIFSLTDGSFSCNKRSYCYLNALLSANQQQETWEVSQKRLNDPSIPKLYFWKISCICFGGESFSQSVCYIQIKQSEWEYFHTFLMSLISHQMYASGIKSTFLPLRSHIWHELQQLVP